MGVNLTADKSVSDSWNGILQGSQATANPADVLNSIMAFETALLSSKLGSLHDDVMEFNRLGSCVSEEEVYKKCP